jgi:hypothetical protein
MKIIAKVMWSEPAQPPKTSLWLKICSRRETQLMVRNYQRTITLTISNNLKKELATNKLVVKSSQKVIA